MQTIQSVIETILENVPDAFRKDTVDTIKVGDPTQAVTGIVTTFLASQAVMGKAVELGANLIITHEPTFYNHLDDTDWLGDDPIYKEKRAFAEQNGLVIWRFHDNLHKHVPDPTFAGIIQDLGWEPFVGDDPVAFNIPITKLLDLAETVKEYLGIDTVRVIGDLEMECRTAGILVGAWGGQNQMKFWRRTGIEVLIVGEIAEWETSEYARDALIQGRKRGLIIIGHANSEEPGMKWLVEWLRPKFPGVPIQHVPVGDPFTFV